MYCYKITVTKWGVKNNIESWYEFSPLMTSQRVNMITDDPNWKRYRPVINVEKFELVSVPFSEDENWSKQFPLTPHYK